MVTRIVRWSGTLFVLVLGVCIFASSVHADTLQSNNFKFDESTVGAGGQIQASSANFQSSSSANDVAVGDAASANYQVQAGSQTTNDPALSFSIGATTAFTTFGASTPATATSTFSVINYTSYGYVVQIAGNTPTNGSKSIPALSSNSASVAGTEQFGLNLVANTAPISYGANPVQDIFGEGVAETNYNTPNSYRYVSGETIASAPKSSGKTTYTLSFLVNVTSLTPGGQYKSDQTLIVTGTY